MKPSLYLFKRDIGRTIENPKTIVHFVVVDSETSKDYPLNFLCVLPNVQGLVSGHTIYSRIFGEESIPLAKRLLAKALKKESDLEIKSQVGQRLKMIVQSYN
jgi:hypothetical protein